MKPMKWKRFVFIGVTAPFLLATGSCVREQKAGGKSEVKRPAVCFLNGRPSSEGAVLKDKGQVKRCEASGQWVVLSTKERPEEMDGTRK